jgi:hypothetical protein
MPDANGKITPAEMLKVQAWFKEHWKGNVVCPICGSDKWTILPDVVSTSPTPAQPLNPNVPTYPFVMVQSQPCGYVLMFNAVSVGIWTRFTPPVS